MNINNKLNNNCGYVQANFILSKITREGIKLKIRVANTSLPFILSSNQSSRAQVARMQTASINDQNWYEQNRCQLWNPNVKVLIKIFSITETFLLYGINLALVTIGSIASPFDRHHVSQWQAQHWPIASHWQSVSPWAQPIGCRTTWGTMFVDMSAHRPVGQSLDSFGLM